MIRGFVVSSVIGSKLLITWKGKEYNAPFRTFDPLLRKSKVYPSGVARATRPTRILLKPPGTFSITTRPLLGVEEQAVLMALH
jgi:hypothetical protein